MAKNSKITAKADVKITANADVPATINSFIPYKSITYADRMQNPVHKCKPSVPHYDTYALEEKRELNPKLGRVLSKSTFKKIEKNPLAHLKVNDFSLENLQAIGAPLNPCTMKHDNNTATAIMENNIAKFNLSQKSE